MYFRLVELHYPYLFMSERHENVFCDVHMHISPEIILVDRGSLNMCVRGREYRINEGEALFVAPYEAHSFTSKEDNSSHVLLFSCDLLSYMMDHLRNNEIDSHIFTPSPILFKMVDEYLPLETNYADPRKAEAILAPFLYEIFEKCRFKKRTQPLEDRLLLALEYITKNFGSEITLEDVARVAGVHPVTLSKSFSQRTGTTFASFIKYTRARHAAELIRNEKLTFTEVAMQSGFGSVRSFNRAFLEVYGSTPTEYRNSAK